MGRRTRQGPGAAHYSGARERNRTRPRSRQFDEQSDTPLQTAEGDLMKNLGYDRALYILPFDHRSSLELKMFGWGENLTPEQTAQIVAAKQVIYDGFKAAVEAGAPKEKAGILVDEDFGKRIEAFNPTFCKVLVRYNPEGDQALNIRQTARLKRLSEYLRANARG